jgi:hypothetical protein
MGMFDEITVHVLGDYVWQTKEMQFQPLLDRFHVDSNGMLSATAVIHPHPDALDTATFSDTVVFYGNPDNRWVEYRATFKDGRLVKLARFKEMDAAYGKGRGSVVHLPWMQGHAPT